MRVPGPPACVLSEEGGFAAVNIDFGRGGETTGVVSFLSVFEFVELLTLDRLELRLELLELPLRLDFFGRGESSFEPFLSLSDLVDGDDEEDPLSF